MMQEWMSNQTVCLRLIKEQEVTNVHGVIEDSRLKRTLTIIQFAVLFDMLSFCIRFYFLYEKIKLIIKPQVIIIKHQEKLFDMVI